MNLVVALIFVCSSNALITHQHHRRFVFPVARIAIHRRYSSKVEILEKQLNLSNVREKKLWEMLNNRDRDIDRIKLQSLEELAKYRAVLEIRSVIEIMLRNWKPQLNSTEASALLVKDHFLEDPKDPQSLQLKEEWLKILKDLEGAGVDSKSVVKDLKDFYHEVSKPIHYPEVAGTKGILIGGTFPLRAAKAMMVLALQTVCKENKNIVIKYCTNENYEPRFELEDGKINILHLKSTGTKEDGTDTEED